MSQNVKGTFASGQSSNLGGYSDTLVIPSGVTTMRFSCSGVLDTNNRIRLQKSTDNGQTWSNGSTYTSAQTNVAVTVANGEQWRAQPLLQQANSAIDYSLSVES